MVKMKLCFFSTTILLLFLSLASGLEVAKFFSPGMVLQEAPIRANIYGTYEDGNVTVSIQCLDGNEEQVAADQVRVLLYILDYIASS